MIVADFNGDGKLDLAISGIAVTFGSDIDEVNVLLGNGDGTFQPPRIITFPVGADPRGLAVGDVNGDGKPDLAVATHFGVSVFLGDGAGGFGSGINIMDAFEPLAVAISDLNGDGAADLVVTHSLPDHDVLSVLLGNGNATFQTGRDFPTGRFSAAVVVADVNGDGIPDLVVANQANSDISVLLGNGDGTFQPTVNYLTGIGPGGLVVTDLNGDGTADIAVTSGVANDVSVLLNQNDGLSPQQGVRGLSHGTTVRPLSIDPLLSSSTGTGDARPMDPVAVRRGPATARQAAELDHFFLTTLTNAERERHEAQSVTMPPQSRATTRALRAPQKPEDPLGLTELSPTPR
jgi:hypothetical protein